MKRYLLIVSFFVFAQPAFSQSQYRFQHFDSKDGLSSDLTEQIFQDSLGFIWTSQPWSVTRYDGYNFKTYRYDPDDTVRSLGNDILRAAYLDPLGNFWVGSTNAKNGFQINKYDRTIDGFRNYRIFTNGNWVTTVSFEKDGATLWLATANGIYSFNTETNVTKHFVNPSADSLTQTRINTINDISILDSCLLLATTNGLWKFDKSQETFGRPSCNAKDSAWLYQEEFYKIYDERSDKFNNVWLLDYTALTKVNKDLEVVQRLKFPDGLTKGDLRRFDSDENGVFWFGTWFKGIVRIDPSDSTFHYIKNIQGDPYSIPADRVVDVKIDRNQNMWIAAYNGISKLPKSSLRFYNFDIKDARIDQSTVYEAGGSEYLIIDKNQSEHKLMIAPLIRGQFEALQFKQLTASFTGEQVNSFWKGKRKFWIASWDSGIVGVPIDSTSGMIKFGPITILSHSATNPNTISSNATISVWEDGNENLWVGIADGGLNKIVPGIQYGDKGSVLRYWHSDVDSTSIANDNVTHLYPEDETSFWLATTINVDLYRNNAFEHFFYKKHLPSCILKSRNGALFIGTGTGLYEGTKTDNGYTFKKSSLVKNIDVLNLKEDHQGRIWLVTGNGLTFYDHKEQIAIEFNKEDGFKHNRVYSSSLNPALTSSGIMAMSDFDGVTIFEPSTLSINRNKTFPLITGISVNNQTPVAGMMAGSDSDRFIIKAGISVLEELVLDHEHNNFTLEFSSMELTSPEKNLYRHKLEGFDEEWIETDWKNRTATYTNLDAGTYTFRVRASNYHGIWSDNERVLSVIILPPPWKTWWAYALYCLAIIAVFLYWRSIENKKLQLRHRATYLSELDSLKTRFFQNISHEFRTPITLIVSPLKEMYGGKFTGDLKSTYGIMLRNGDRLLRLINQLLDLSKLEAGKMQMNSTVIDLVEFLREIAAAYESLAANKAIKYSFDCDVARLPILADEEKLEKVFHNLLSNAFKFTKEGGEIGIRVTVVEKRQAVISVRDTGIGIPADQLTKVFDRFYQVDSSQTREYEGSGLGMALAKEFVELHNGKISVESKEGRGSTFTVKLPLGKDEVIEKAFKLQDQKINELSGLEELIGSEGEKEISSNEEPASVSEPTTILIIEDNTDMRNYIRKTLSTYYQVIEAKNGKEGFQKATDLLPDLIISDVMMPEMDGYKLCTLIKTNELTSHIPVILLTAKADRESKLIGLETHADDYLSKPFDMDELKLIVRNRVEERRKMRERFSREIKLEPKHISITSLDEKFITNVLAQIEEHMGDENFSIEELSIQAGYSAMHLYRKIKSLTGQTPSQFVRTIRLKRAAELLSRKSDNISQIAYQVGFSNVSYFNKCFKDQFEMTPGDFLKTNQVKN